ncbi:MAG: hypothetical protein ABUT20_45235 [Bacteroidota bacterium]
MKSIKRFGLVFTKVIVIALFFYGCFGNNYDSALETPDGHGGGYVLTPLGRLLYGPWQVEDSYRHNVAIYIDDKEISSIGQPCTEIEKELIFELQRDGSLKYWFKKDYERQLTHQDSVLEKEGIIRGTHFRPGVDQIKKMYTKGSWQANFNDSTLIIRFGDSNLPELNGRYSKLGSGFMNFQRVSFFDSVYNGQKVKLKKVITTYYEHPWNNW